MRKKSANLQLLPKFVPESNLVKRSKHCYTLDNVSKGLFIWTEVISVAEKTFRQDK